MHRGISEVTAVGGVVSLIARTMRGVVALQLNVSHSVYEPWMADAMWDLLNRIDPPSRVAWDLPARARGSLALVPVEE